MKDYKRLTVRRSFGVIDNCANCPNINNKQGCTDKKCYEIMRNRLADLEDKIESGELCDREEVRKETAREILQIIRDSAHIHFAMRKIAKKYGVKLEEQQ